MQLEDSYEGAVRRLARLSTINTPSDELLTLRERVQDLEQLATLATDENERLEKELARANDTISRLKEQLTERDRQRLRELVEAPAPVENKPRRSVLPYLAAMMVLGIAAAGAAMYRPWVYAEAFARPRLQSPWVALHNAAAVPIVIEEAKPVAPKVVALAPAPEPVVAPAPAPQKKAKKSKHHHKAVAKAAKKARPVAAAAKADDPLLGL